MSDYTALWNGDFSRLDAVAESATVHHPLALVRRNPRAVVGGGGARAVVEEADRDGH